MTSPVWSAPSNACSAASITSSGVSRLRVHSRLAEELNPGPGHPRHQDARAGRVRADGPAESGSSRRRHHSDDRQPRRSRSEADSRDSRAQRSISSRNPSTGKCCRRWSSVASSCAGVGTRTGGTFMRLERELGEARAFQQGLLAAAEKVVEQLAISCRYVSCSELGGDLCDYVSIGSGKVGVARGRRHGSRRFRRDVDRRRQVRFSRSNAEGYEPRPSFSDYAGDMAAFGSERFVTLIAAVVAVAKRRLDYVNAGHPAGLLFSEGATGVPTLEHGSARVARICASPYGSNGPWTFNEGDLLLLYTDGVSDALAGRGRFGERGRPGGRQGTRSRGCALCWIPFSSRVRERVGGRSLWPMT